MDGQNCTMPTIMVSQNYIHFFSQRTIQSHERGIRQMDIRLHRHKARESTKAGTEQVDWEKAWLKMGNQSGNNCWKVKHETKNHLTV